MISTLWSKSKSHLFAIVGFVAVVFIAFQPMFTKNRVMSQHDVQMGVGATKQLLDYERETGETALWMYTMFSGMPAYLNSVDFAGNLLDNIQSILHLGIPRPPQIIFLTCLSFYIMLLTFRVRPWIAFIGAVIFGFNGFNIIGIIAGHNSKIQAVAYMPLVIAGLKLAFDQRRLIGMALFALGLGLHIQANHLQMTYYLLVMVVIFGLVELIGAIRKKELPNFAKNVGFLVIAATLAVGANFGKLWTVIEYSQYSTRGKKELTQQGEAEAGLDKSYAFQYSNGIFEPLVMIVPNILGGSSQNELDRDSEVGSALRRAGYSGTQLDQQLQSVPTYWGDQPLTAPYYLGSSLLFLLALGFMYASRTERQWLITWIVLGVVLSWGSNFSSLNDFIFNYFPGYNKFRSVTFTIVMAMFGITILAATGFERFLKSDKKERIKKLFTALTVAGGFGVLLLFASFMLGYQGAIDQRINADWFVAALREDRQSLLQQDAWRLIIFSILLAAGLWAWATEKLNKTLLLSLLIAVALIDVVGLSKRFLTEDTFSRKTASSYGFTPTEADLYIQSIRNPGERVLNLQNPFNDARTSYFHESVGGYHGAKMGRYQDIIEYYLSDEHATIINGLRNNQRSFADANVLNMLNTRYFIAGSGRNMVLANANALGAAWTVNDVQEASNPDEEIDMIGQVNPSKTAIINSSQFDIPQGISGNGIIALEEKTPNYLRYTATISGGKAALGVFSEVYYPKGWKATIDGESVPILRVNYILRGLTIPAGEHVIEFRFEPASYYTGAGITWVFNILLILTVLVILGLEIRKGLSKSQ